MEDEQLQKIKDALNVITVNEDDQKQMKSSPSEKVLNFNPDQVKSGYLSDPGMAGTKPKMPVYIGTKVVQAEPMTQENFLKKQGKWQENQETYGEGYFVKYDDGYESWSPKDVFERCYRQLTKSEISIIY